MCVISSPYPQTFVLPIFDFYFPLTLFAAMMPLPSKPIKVHPDYFTEGDMTVEEAQSPMNYGDWVTLVWSNVDIAIKDAVQPFRALDFHCKMDRLYAINLNTSWLDSVLDRDLTEDFIAAYVDLATRRFVAAKTFQPRPHCWCPRSIVEKIGDGLCYPQMLHACCDIGPGGRGWLALGVGGLVWPEADYVADAALQYIDIHCTLMYVDDCHFSTMLALKETLMKFVCTFSGQRKEISKWKIVGREGNSGSGTYAILDLVRERGTDTFYDRVRDLQHLLTDEAERLGVWSSVTYHGKPHLSVRSGMLAQWTPMAAC